MTLSPLGEWTGWYQSEEIKNAEKYGYKFEILRGYKFEKAIIFNSNKRIPIYSEDNVFIGIKPFTIKEDQIINREKESIDTN